MQNKLLVCVPHPDDELNIIGQILPSVIEAQWECYICFSTNGDALPWNGKYRLQEALGSLALFGVRESNVFFLGYPDSRNAEHIYHTKNGEVVLSSSGSACASTVLSDHVCLSEAQHGKPRLNTRQSFYNDLYELIGLVRADVIVSVDYDWHPDHRALSLLMEEVLGDYCLKNVDYSPMLLKKFAYTSCWEGPKDYYSFLPSLPPPDSSSPFELDNPAYSWSERVILHPHKSTITRNFFNNRMYRAARLHKSQVTWPYMLRVCNSDVVYWLRRTDNLLFQSELNVSSGDKRALRDMKYFDTNSICDELSECQFCQYGWYPDPTDDKKLVSMGFSRQVSLSQIVLCESIGNKSEIELMELTADGEPVLKIQDLDHFGKRTVYLFKEPVKCMRLELRIVRFSGKRPGLNSIELFSEPDDVYLRKSQFIEDVDKRSFAPPEPLTAWYLGLGIVSRISSVLSRFRQCARKWRFAKNES